MLLEARPYRPFKSSEEYLEAMKEDLAEWLNTLYPELSINAENFMDRLDTGVALCKVGGINKFFSRFYVTKALSISSLMVPKRTSLSLGLIAQRTLRQ